jgi:hypothetical protein
MLKHRVVKSPELQMLKHRGTVRIDDAETQRKSLQSAVNKHQPSLLHKNADTVKSAIHVAETAREL